MIKTAATQVLKTCICVLFFMYALFCLSQLPQYKLHQSKVTRGLNHKQSMANTGVILVCHLSQVINADHCLNKTCVETVRASLQINGFGHLFSH